MTAGRRDGKGTPFNEWIRALPPPLDSRNGYHLTDLDGSWLYFDDPVPWRILLEFKTYGAWPDKYQWDNLSIAAQQSAAGAHVPVDTLRGRREVRFRGLFLISLSGEVPAADEPCRISWVSGFIGWKPDREWRHVHDSEAAVREILATGELQSVGPDKDWDA